MTSVDSPTRAAARASVALTTVLPTPPFPATMTSRDAAKNRAGSKNSLPGRAGPGRLDLRADAPEATHRHRRARAAGRRLCSCSWPQPAPPGAGRPRRPGRHPAAATPGFVSVIKVSGLLDRVLVDFVETQLRSAQRDGAVALVLQLNSKGAVVDQGRLDELVHRIEAVLRARRRLGRALRQPGHRRRHRPAGRRPHHGRRPGQPGRGHPHPRSGGAASAARPPWATT